MNTGWFGGWGCWLLWCRYLVQFGQRGFSGVGLLQALAGILVLTVIVPPGFAVLVNRSRIDRAQKEIFRLADALQGIGLAERVRNEEGVGLLGGPGVIPQAPSERQWTHRQVGNLGSYVSQPVADPWGNRYLVNIGVVKMLDTADGSPDAPALWVLSAGPNGVIETPFASPVLLAVVEGDDIGARIN